MAKTWMAIFLTVFLVIMVSPLLMAECCTVTVHVGCNDSYTEALIEGEIRKELRALGDVTLVEQAEKPQFRLSLMCVKIPQDDVVGISIQFVQYVFSNTPNATTGKFDYFIWRADHSVAVVPTSEIKEECSNIVTRFDVGYLETIRSYERTTKSK